MGETTASDEDVFNQVVKYRKRLKVETDSEIIRHALKRLHELAPSATIVHNAKLAKIIQVNFELFSLFFSWYSPDANAKKQ